MGRKDLDYLQWLQQNSRIHLIGMTILTFLVVLSICLFYTNPWQPQQDSISFFAEHDSDETAAEQDASEDQQAEAEPQDDTALSDSEQKQQAAAPLPAKDTTANVDDTSKDAIANQQTEQEDAALKSQHEQEMQQVPATEQSAAEQTEQAPTVQNPMQVNGFTAPCRGTLLYSYGVGYDPVYEDYRFHDSLCYQADGETVVAATAGTVQTVALEQQAQLIVQCGNNSICYNGLQSYDVQVGDTLTAGQPIGTAGMYLYVKAYCQ